MVALKTFRSELLLSQEAREAFRKESLLWVNLEEHPHIVAARSVSEVSGRLFVEMDYVARDPRGRASLQDHLATAEGPLDITQILGWAMQFCLGMEHAQAHGLQIHRDIKPSNVLVTQHWTLKIGDFGLATAAVAAFEKSDNNRGSVVKGTAELIAGFSVARTQAGIRCGTPGYIAPEVYRCEPIDTRSDIYSFGVILWQLASGSSVPPWGLPRSPDMESYERAVYQEQMAGHVSAIGGPLGLVIGRCLRPSASVRYATFTELRELLQLLWKQKTGTAFPIPKVSERSGTFWNRKGASLSALRRHQEAIECFDKAIDLSPRYAAAWSNRAGSLIALQRYQDAIECCDKAAAIDPMLAPAWNNKGLCCAELGRNAEAVECYDHALVLNAMDAAAWYNRGKALAELGQTELALASFDKTLAIEPKHLLALGGKGYGLFILGRNDESMAYSDQALAIDPLCAKAWSNKGIALGKTRRYEEAIRCFEKALTIDSGDAMAWSNKGLALAGQGKYAEAIAHFDKSLVIDSQKPLTWTNKATFLTALGRHDEAVTCYKAALAIDPRDVKSWQGLALSLRMKES